jgi:sodium/potassium-transporting ATPase subunit beta
MAAHDPPTLSPAEPELGRWIDNDSDRPVSRTPSSSSAKSDERILFGRPWLAWFKLLLFYATFYSVLLLLWTVMFGIFYQTVDQRIPVLRYGESAIGPTPGMSIRPRPPIDDPYTTLIHFTSTDRPSYRHYVEDLQAFLDTYVDVKHGSDIAGLDSCVGRLEAPEGQYCPFDINTEIKQTSVCFNASREFGYADGKPCVLIKLNNLFDWVSQPFLDAQEYPETLRMHLPSHMQPGRVLGRPEPLIYFTCEGETPADVENIGRIEYIPKQGVAPYYYPFQNPDGYRAPFVFVRFANPTSGMLISVECRAWARNIPQRAAGRAGRVRFELFID